MYILPYQPNNIKGFLINISLRELKALKMKVNG